MQEEQFVKYHLRSKERFELGNIVEYEGHPMVIEESQTFLMKGALYYTYILGFEASLSIPKKSNAHIQGISLLGKVFGNRKSAGKIRT